MEILIANKVKHKKNDEYNCVLVQFGEEDKHFFEHKQNWMPLTIEVYALHQMFLALDPDYREMIRTDKATKEQVNQQ